VLVHREIVRSTKIMAGNRLGSRKSYIYITDISTVGYIYTTDEDLAVAGLGVGGAAPDEFDPANPPAGITLSPAPRNFTFRTVFAQSTTDGARKNLIAASPSANLYVSSNRQAVPSIDSDTTFVTTGRKGEQISF
jgi:hypothetical protein